MRRREHPALVDEAAAAEVAAAPGDGHQPGELAGEGGAAADDPRGRPGRRHPGRRPSAPLVAARHVRVCKHAVDD